MNGEQKFIGCEQHLFKQVDIFSCTANFSSLSCLQVAVSNCLFAAKAGLKNAQKAKEANGVNKMKLKIFSLKNVHVFLPAQKGRELVGMITAFRWDQLNARFGISSAVAACPQDSKKTKHKAINSSHFVFQKKDSQRIWKMKCKADENCKNMF